MNTLKINIPLIAVFLCLIVLQACKPDTQTVTKTPLTVGNDTTKINQLIKKGRELENSSSDSLLPLKNKLYKLGKLHDDKRALVYSEIFYSHYCWLKARHKLGMQVAIQSLNDAEKWGINEVLPQIYSIISNLHKESSNYDLAFKAIDKGIKAARFNKDTGAIIGTLGNKAMFTHSYYNFTDQPQNDHISLGLQLSALKIAESSPRYERMRIRFYNNIAQTYKERKNYDKTLYYANKAIALANKYNQPRSLTYSFCWIGEAYYYMGQHQKGLDYLNKAIAITTQIKEPYRRMELNDVVYELYKSSGQFEQALTAYKKYTKQRDSLDVIMNARQLNELQLNYDAIKKDKQIAILNQLNTLNRRYVWVVSVSAFIFMVLFIMILFQYFIIRKNNKLIEGKNTGLSDALLKIAFIQSHEIRKPLSTLLAIMNLIKEENYEADKDVLIMMERSAQDLDKKICQIIKEVEEK